MKRKDNEDLYGRTLCNIGEHPTVLCHLQATVQDKTFVLNEVCQPIVEHTARVIETSPLKASHHCRCEDFLEAVRANPWEREVRTNRVIQQHASSVTSDLPQVTV